MTIININLNIIVIRESAQRLWRGLENDHLGGVEYGLGGLGWCVWICAIERLFVLDVLRWMCQISISPYIILWSIYLYYKTMHLFIF